MNPRHPFWRVCDRVGFGVLAVLLISAVVLPWIETDWYFHERLVSFSFGVTVFLGVMLLAALLFALPVRDRHKTSYGQALRRVSGWIARWHGMTFIGIMAGALAGSLIYPLGGLLLQMEGSSFSHFLKGLRDGAMYLTIWAPGGALVLCFMLAFGPAASVSPGKE